MPRLFVGLRPPPAVRAIVAGTMKGVAAARWQDDDQCHLTIRFIGEVDRHRAADILAALGRVHAAAPALRLAGVGGFARRTDRRRRIDTLWAGVTPRDAIKVLHRQVNEALGLAGVHPEPRVFHPHITLARCAPGMVSPVEIAAWQAAHAALSSPVFVCDRLILFDSDLTRSGAVYTQLARWPLVPGDAAL